MGSLNPENDSKQELNDSGCVQDASVTDNYKGQTHLLDLPDDVMLCILRLCTPHELKALGHTCPRLGALVCDRSLWHRVDARGTPTGPVRFLWYLTHGLSASTRELKLTGYVNRNNKCLGIQDLTGPKGNSHVDVEHFLLRMWYPHLPRNAMSPRWPDQREAAGMACISPNNVTKSPLGPLSQLASHIGTGASTSGLSTSKPSSSNLPANLSNTGPNSSNSGQNSKNSRPNSSSSGLNSSNFGPNSSHFEPDPGEFELNARFYELNADNADIDNPNPAAESNDSDSKEDKMESLIADCHGPQFTVNERLLRTLRNKCTSLTSMELEYCNLDYKNTNLRNFPPKLKKLSLKGTRCYNLPLNLSFLGKIQELLPELECLDVSECDWFEPASLMPISKMPNLRELYMKDCRRLTECVAYTSLATRYGFQKLKVLDVRGSPVADSEVSAFGWLPLLEELYVAPPRDFRTAPEHSHKWDDVFAPFVEVEPWETEDPEYYKCKTLPPEYMETDEDTKEEKKDDFSEPRLGDVMGNYITCASLERRIIVIHPNRQNNQNNIEPEDPREEAERPAAAEPAPEPGPSKRPHSDSVLDLVKRPRLDKGTNTIEEFKDSNDEEKSTEPKPESANAEPNERQSADSAARDPDSPDAGPSGSKDRKSTEPGPSGSKGRDSTEPGPSGSNNRGSPNAGPSESNDRGSPNSGTNSRESASPTVTIRRVDPPRPNNRPINRQIDQPARQRQNHRQFLNAGPGGDRVRHRHHSVTFELYGRHLADLLSREIPNGDYIDDIDRPNQNAPAEGPMGVRPIFARARRHLDQLAAQAARPPVAVHARPIPDRGNARPDGQPQRRFMHMDIDIGRQNHHLVSDSAVLRFGRSENDNVNYIHIGLYHPEQGDPGSRPDRSNLRVLSITGFGSITNRSLEHLATAAPHIRHIDFSCTGVTARGVEVFKAIRPNCNVLF